MDTLNKRSWWENLTRFAFILVVAIFAGLFLMYLVYLLPSSLIKENVLSSYKTLESEGEYPAIKYEMLGEGGVKDNYTDAIMLSEAYFNDANYSTLERAMLNEKYGTGVKGLGSLLGYGEDAEPIVYARYWHGYLVFLKPLLLIMNLQQIRIFNIVMQSLLVVFVLFLFYKKCRKLLLPYLISIITISPYIISQSMQFADIYVIFNISVAIILLFYDRLEKNNNLIFLFFIIGIVTSFFDFLTYPLATLGMPLVLVLYLRKNKDETLKQKFFYLVKLFICWAGGYLLFWASKWILATIITNQNIVLNAYDEMVEKVGDAAALESHGWFGLRFYAIGYNLKVFFNLKNTLIIGLVVAVGIVLLIIFRKKVRFDWKNIIPLIIVFLLPFGWYVVVANHSFIHKFFTHRILVCTVFAAITIMTLIFENIGRKKEIKQNG